MIDAKGKQKNDKLRFNDEQLAAFEKIFNAETDDERRKAIRELMDATKRKENCSKGENYDQRAKERL